MKCASYNTFFETIANKTRMAILEALSDSSLSVSEICKKTGLEQSKVSHNLKILNDCHVIEVEQKGKQRIYSLNKDTIMPLMKLVEKHVKDHCCGSCRLKR